VLNDALTASATYSPPLVKFEDQWKSIVIDGKEVPMVWPGSKEATAFDTGAPAEVLQKAGRGSVEVPAGFVRTGFLIFRQAVTGSVAILQEIHPRLQRHVKSRLASLDKGEGIDWATAEVRGFHER
jgi:probable 2-oxoglutarate dehydrogenase E1 component DHKTD1